MVEGDEHPTEPKTGADPEPGSEGFGDSSRGSPADGLTDSSADDPAGIVSIRGGLIGLGFIWLTAVSAFAAMGAAVYGVTTAGGYLAVALVAAALSVAAGSASLRAFGYR